MSRRSGDAGREDGRSLYFGRQRSNEVNPRFRQQFADLLEADLRFASRDDCGNPLTFDSPALGQHLLRNPELLKEFGREVCSADACRIGDRLCG